MTALTTLDETTTTMMTMITRATTPALRRATRAAIAIATTAKTPAYQWQQCLRIGDSDDTSSASSLAAGGRVIT
jgi:hypothetical protein